MLKIISFLFFIHTVTFLFSQQIVTAGGDYHENSSGAISYTIGETVIETFSGTNNYLTQGFHQTELVAVAIKEIRGLDYEISVFPNPTDDFIFIKIPQDKVSGLEYMLYNFNGSLIENKRIESSETKVSFSNLTQATYLIKITEGKRDLKTFKIIKK